MLGNLLPLLGALLAVAAVIYLSYLISRYIAMGTARMSSAKYMKTVDRVVLGQDRMLLIVMVGGKYYLIGASAQNINVLKELSPEEMIPVQPEGENGGAMKSFQSTLKTMITKKEK